MQNFVGNQNLFNVFLQILTNAIGIIEDVAATACALTQMEVIGVTVWEDGLEQMEIAKAGFLTDSVATTIFFTL